MGARASTQVGVWLHGAEGAGNGREQQQRGFRSVLQLVQPESAVAGVGSVLSFC